MATSVPSIKKAMKGGKKSKGSADKAPIFLRKTYNMIDTCDPEICTWSDSGSAFVVKQPQKFASEVLGLFFKHNNFSSFVRQLNFYGFRKVKSDHLRIRDAASDVESRYWKFRHEKFCRGHPDWLVDIRKQKHSEEPDKQDVEGLKRQVKDLKARVNSMSQKMDEMAMFMTQVMQNQQQQQVAPEEQPSKRRKTMEGATPSYVHSMAVPMEATSMTAAGSPPPAMPSRQAIMKQNSIDVLIGDMVAPPLPGRISPVPFGSSANARTQSGASFTSTDEAILSTLFADDHKYQDYSYPLSVHLPPAAPSAAANNHEGSEGEPDPALMHKLRQALTVLPEKMQEQLVDRIVATVADPEHFQTEIDAVAVANPNDDDDEINVFAVSPHSDSTEDASELPPLNAI